MAKISSFQLLSPGVLALFFQLFQLLCLILFIIKNGVQQCQRRFISWDTGLSSKHICLWLPLPGWPSSPAGARQPCLPAFSSLLHPPSLLWAAGALGLKVPSFHSYLHTQILLFTHISITLSGNLFWLLGRVGMAPLQGTILSHLKSLLFSTRLEGIVFVSSHAC